MKLFYKLNDETSDCNSFPVIKNLNRIPVFENPRINSWEDEIKNYCVKQ